MTAFAPPPPRPLVLVTGLSGAGLSTALKALEDHGYEAVDNLRLSLVMALVEQSDAMHRPLAIGIDSRTRDFDSYIFLEQLAALQRRADLTVRLVFLDCSDEVLQRRFTETRRRHPLAADRPVADGIQRERILLALLKDHADTTIDTSDLSIRDLRRLAVGHCRLDGDSGLNVFVTSFSFRLGLPREADLVFDVRFLDNPYYVPSLRPLSGLDAGVVEVVTADRDFAAFFEHLTGLLRSLLPRYNQEGKSYLTIAIGCTGGRHRSVVVAERLAGWLRDEGYKVGSSHRDLERSGLERSGLRPG
ncbi:MAG: RNase adapter RapZ [Azospirillum sp.]|nr:RNase adapter RapZ [Azospirillum sp.]